MWFWSCSAADRSNIHRALRKRAAPGVVKQDTMARFTTKTQTSIMARNREAQAAGQANYSPGGAPGRRYEGMKPLPLSEEYSSDGSCQFHPHTPGHEVRSTTPTRDTGRRLRRPSGGSQIPRSTSPSNESRFRIRRTSGSASGGHEVQRAVSPERNAGRRTQIPRSTTPTSDTGRKVRRSSSSSNLQHTITPVKDSGDSSSGGGKSAKIKRTPSGSSRIPLSLSGRLTPSKDAGRRI